MSKLIVVIPTKVGTHCRSDWVPAFAGMMVGGSGAAATCLPSPSGEGPGVGNEGAAEFYSSTGAPPPGRAKRHVSRPSPEGEGRR